MRSLLVQLTAALCVGATLAQYGPTTPVPILKQINRHNEDGSYSYGYEAADGSYKIESKYPTGEVYGKYGFVDDTGNVREVEYGASRRGFEPAGTGINVPPPTLHANSLAAGGGRDDGPEDDGQYREDPAIYYTDPRYTNGERYEPVPRKYPKQNYGLHQPVASYKPLPNSKPVAPVYRRPAPLPAPLPVHQPLYRQEYQPQYRTQYQSHYQPAPVAAPAPAPLPYRPPSRYGPQPISHLDSNLAAYSVNYRR